MKRHDRPLTAEEIAAVRDEDIDFSDIPELDESFWRNAERIECAATGKVFFTAEISQDGRFVRPAETNPPARAKAG